MIFFFVVGETYKLMKFPEYIIQTPYETVGAQKYHIRSLQTFSYEGWDDHIGRVVWMTCWEATYGPVGEV